MGDMKCLSISQLSSLILFASKNKLSFRYLGHEYKIFEIVLSKQSNHPITNNKFVKL